HRGPRSSGKTLDCRLETPATEDVLHQSQRHADARAGESEMPIHALGELARHERPEERTEVDPHVEDREPGVPALVALFVQRSDEGRDVRLEQPGPYHDQGEPSIEQWQGMKREREVAQRDD